MGLVCNPEENPEEHMGEEIPDPWDDPNQMDWPKQRKEATGDGDVLDPDSGS